MKLKLLLVALLFGAGAATDLFACGNKFLIPSRGTRFGKVPIARQAANILVYTPPNSALSQALGELSVATVLTRVGYKPTTVTGPDELDAALRKGGWDLVLADLATTTALRERLKDRDAPAILPVVHEPSRSQLAAAKETYGEVIRTPVKSQRFVETVDYAVAERAQRLATASH